MICTLCKKDIKNYNEKFNHLVIDKDNKIEICLYCMDKIGKWQKEIYAKLFPTKTAKKYLER